ncbi:MAG: bifunctional (p)ppGpp synthetase/guanosine-3',5'-bis(diphosphate) 3'-pyrophosphohydrolase [Gammaproteobacteria bacterium]|nr:bifunctional (p)ppGpp synthetase/guanosine-3',5'-bis(diphosphate) 3'-pyrophosphohydrolase [Gammaproteobacteria bacterium]
MQSTRQYSQVTQRYSIDEYLRLIAPSIEDLTLLRKACEKVWQLPADKSLPDSLDVALLLSELGSDETTLIVALLSTTLLIDSPEATDLESIFGEKIISMVKNVCQLHAFQAYDIDETPDQAERLRRMLLSMVGDIRVVLIKLAYRVQRLRQLKQAPPEQQQSIARETLDIFAPIANRLGIGQLKWELEDLSFRYLEPETYQRIASYLDEKREEREDFIVQVVATLKQELEAAGVKAEVYGRSKHIYSIWKKMTAKHRDFDELFDVRAVRIVVEDVADCYMTLGLVHGLWRHIEKEFDDYIANPKDNGYQSLHTAVRSVQGKPFEIQIRTKPMDEFAEHGVAAHWRYKEGKQADASIQESINSLRKLLDPEQTRDEDLLDNFRTEMFHDRVYVLTPEGRVIDLPQGATPIDFAYAVHTEVGHRCRGAKVNGRIVQLTYELKNGEQVEILTSKEASPVRDWLIPHLSYTKTTRARNRIRSWFRHQDRDKNLIEGKALYEREVKRQGVRPNMDAFLKACKHNSAEELFVDIGRGDFSISQLSAALYEQKKSEQGVDIPILPRPRRQSEKSSSSKINVRGVGNLLTTMANCCKPVPGDDIIGFITRGKGVSIHRKDCTNIINLNEDDFVRLIEVEWGRDDNDAYPVNLVVNAIDRQGLLGDVITTLANDKVNVIAVNTLSDKNEQTARMLVTIEIHDLQQLTRIMDKIGQLPNVTEVLRGSSSPR